MLNELHVGRGQSRGATAVFPNGIAVAGLAGSSDHPNGHPLLTGAA